MDDDARSRRQIARSERRSSGDHSAQLARTLMNLSAPALARLAIDDELRAAIDRARSITALVARRRAERTLAKELRGQDLDEIEATLGAAEHADAAGARKLHQIEQWRAQLIEGGSAAIAALPPGIADDELPRLVDAARRERDTGRPPGAGRALFRYLAKR